MVNSIIAELRQTLGGAAALDDWLGVGGVPVEQNEAERRALICLFGHNGRPCPENRAPKWWERFFKNPIAMAIRRHLQVKHQIGLRVTTEEHLHMCRCCGCCLPLKVHVPMEHIQAHLKPEVKAKLPGYCWMRA